MTDPADAVREAVDQWFEKADEDIFVALLIARTKPLAACSLMFHCQQAVEKSIKAYLTFRSIEFPKVHDLRKLLRFIRPVDPVLASALRRCTWISGFAVIGRYPADIPDPSDEEARQALADAEFARVEIGKAMEK